MKWFRRENRDEDLERELRSDLELEAAELQERGLSPRDAEYAARRAFGNKTFVKEEVRRAWGGIWFEDLVQDARHTVRYLRKSPGFTITAVLSLAIGIGANTAIFSVIDAVLLKSLPVRDPQTLIVVGPAHGSGNGSGIPLDGSFSLYSYDLYKHLRTTHVFAELCAVQSTHETDVGVRRAGWSETELGHAKLISGNYFDVLGVKAALGRSIAPADDAAFASPAAVVSFRYWKGRLGGKSSIVGSNISVGGTSFTIVGVAPPDFYGEELEPDPPDFWLPLSADRWLNHQRALIDQPDEHWLYLIGRLAPDVSVAEAQIRLSSALRNWLLSREGSKISAEDCAEIMRAHVELTPGGSGIIHMRRNYGVTLRLLLGISLVVLLITCANISNLLLARGTARATETSVRLALGANRWRLTRQLLTESLVLALAGGAVGLFLAESGTKLLIALFFRGTEYVPISASPDLRILSFAFVLSCSSAMVFGLLPAFRMTSRIAPVIRGASAGIKGSRLSARSFGLGAVLVVTEVALSLVVLAGAATFARSLANLSGQHFGFDRNRVLILNVDTRHAGYSYTHLRSLYRELYSRLNALPGVKSASFSFYSPFNGCCSQFSISVQGYTPKPNEHVHARLNRVSPRYFQTLGTRLLLGRDFAERDFLGSQPIAIVTEEFVRLYLPKQNPIGKHFGIGGARHAGDLEIVGVVADAKYDDPHEDIMPMAFFPLLQDKSSDMPLSSDESNFVQVIEIRSAGRAETIASEVRHALAEIDPAYPC